MKKTLQFLRTTLAGGLLFLVPIVVLVMVLGKAMAILHKLVDPLATRLPVQSVIGLRTPMLLAIVLLIFFCFLAGCFARTPLARKIINDLERAVLSRVPGYEFFKEVSEGILSDEKSEAYPVVLVRFDDAWQLGFQVEVLGNGLVAVFLPGAPNPLSGVVHFMTADRVTPAGVPLVEMLKCLKRLGAGSGVLVGDLPVPSVPPPA